MHRLINDAGGFFPKLSFILYAILCFPINIYIECVQKKQYPNIIQISLKNNQRLTWNLIVYIQIFPNPNNNQKVKWIFIGKCEK